ncbi:hypothetical protein JTB14_020731 [Gonioctena quinquepunctata]|nr:hypothetical protein JTB14_020731 [Gonioctena quinquepunctata]
MLAINCTNTVRKISTVMKMLGNLTPMLLSKAIRVEWKNLRDASVRHRRQEKSQKSGAGAKPAKTYIYAKQFEFLRRVTDSCQTESSLPSTLQESQDDPDLSQDHNDTQDRQLVDVNRETQIQIERTPSRSTQFRRKKSALESKFITFIDSRIKQPSPVIQNQPKETDDLAFFRSLQTSSDTLSPNEKLNFRIDVLQLLTPYTNKKPNQDTPNFPNFTPAYRQP